MGLFAPLRTLTAPQRRAFVASFLGWTLDAFDFFLLTFVVTRIAGDFRLAIPAVAFAITITLMCRPLGALIFGVAADRYGRRVPLMISVALYSVFELLTAFSPNFTAFLVLRALYGVAMGGEWGVGAALALETLPAQARGIASGILQQGYATGYLLAAIVFAVVGSLTTDWRIFFVIGVLPALLVFYIRSGVEESPAWRAGQARQIGERTNLLRSIVKQPLLYLYAIALMTAFNFMSHGSQDLFPTFLTKQQGYPPSLTGTITAIMNVGAIVGGTVLGAWSQTLGRRMTVIVCCVLGAACIPLWSGMLGATVPLLTLGAFLIQVFVQGAWGVIPAHLNELSPGGVRGTFPGFTYQLGNLFSAYAAQWEAAYATKNFPLPAPQTADYGHAMRIIMAAVFAAVLLLAAIGPERRGVAFTPEPDAEKSG
ncbi:MAG TPA: MFS transporter [Candidatus Elarobacter sp.]|jgi:SHS family lactate transporter-like MFS transporter